MLKSFLLWVIKKFYPDCLLEELAKSALGKEFILGVQDLKMPSLEDRKTNAERIVKHSLSPEYETWAKAVWSLSLTYMDKVISGKSQTEVDFNRGAFKASQDILRVPYKMKSEKKQIERSLNSSAPRS